MTENTDITSRPLDWSHELAEQVDWHWTNQLRPRLDGLTDAEYFWQPAPDSWTVHPRSDEPPAPPAVEGGAGDFVVDFAFPEPTPAPVTTIAWRLAHVIVGVLAMRNAAHFGGPAADYFAWEYAGTAAEALAQLDEAYARWISGVRAFSLEELARPCGEEGPYAEHSMAALVLHINRELIHHGAEIALLRDLYAHR